MFQVILKNLVYDCCKESVSECVSIYNADDHDILHNQFSIIPHLFGNLMEEKNCDYLLKKS